MRDGGVTEQTCHTSNVILSFSILRYQDGRKYAIKTMILGAFHWCHGAKVSHVQRNINFFDFKISRWSKIYTKKNAFGCIPLVSQSTGHLNLNLESVNLGPEVPPNPRIKV